MPSLRPHQCIPGPTRWPSLGLPALPSPRIATSTCLKATGHVKAHLSVPVCSKPNKGFLLIQGVCLAPARLPLCPQAPPEVPHCHLRRLPQPGGHTPAQPSPSSVCLSFCPVTPHPPRLPAAPISQLPVPALSQSPAI